MNRIIASFFSWFFQPLLMASYLSAILLWIAPASIGSFFSTRIKFWIWLVIFLTTFLIPVIGLIVMRLSSSIKDIQLPEREERVMPFFFIAIFYCVAAFLMVSRLNISGIVNIIFMATAVLVLISTVITLFWKISIHSIAMTGVLGFLVALNAIVPDSIPIWIVICWVLGLGITVSSRLYLNIHDQTEVYAGCIFGFLFCYLSIYLFV